MERSSPVSAQPDRVGEKRAMKVNKFHRGRRGKAAAGFTLLELIVAAIILSILTMMALPLARVTIQREKEKELRKALWETLVKGVDMQGGKKVRFLRSIPTDPMTKSKEWGLRSMQDDADSDSWGGQSVFDVYTKSEGTALDGTKYKDW